MEYLEEVVIVLLWKYRCVVFIRCGLIGRGSDGPVVKVLVRCFHKVWIALRKL